MFSPMLNLAPLPKPKPVKVIKSKKRKKNSKFCACKNFWLNKTDPKTCSRCGKILKAKKYRKALEDFSDSIVREIVLKRDRFCVCPAPKDGHSGTLQCGHLYSRVKESVKWDLRNCNCQCNGCNQRHEHYWHHYADWFTRQFGEEERLRVSKDSDTSQKLSVEQLQTLCDELSAIKARQEIDKEFVPRYSQAEIISGTWRKENERTNTMQELSEWVDLGNKGAD